MQHYLSFSLLFSLLSAPIVTAQTRPMAYVISMSGEWRDTRTDLALAPLSVLMPNSELRLVPEHRGKAPMIRVRFTDGLCEETIHCSEAVPCSQPFPVEQLFARLGEACRVKNGSWTGAIVAAWNGFFHPQTGAPALAMTLSRGGDSNDDEGDDPALQEAVLLVDGGRVELGPLFRKVATGAFSLQFCDPGPALAGDCGESVERDRVAVNIVNGRPTPAVFSKAEGLYRVRLWKMTPKGQQPTERTAITLVGAKSSYAGTQKAFLEISVPASDLARTDSMIRVMLSAWLAQNRGKNMP